MNITRTHFFLSVLHVEKPAEGQTNKDFAFGFNTLKPTHLQSKLKQLTLIFCVLMVIGVSSALGQAGSMVAGTFTVTSGTPFSWYDPGGLGGGYPCPTVTANNYANSLDITETMTANVGQKIIISWASSAFGLASGDVLVLHDGPNTGSPVLATYNSATPSTPIPAFQTTSSNSITFHFTSDATNNCRGWSATIAAYYFMSNTSVSFSCPATYTFVDFQNIGSGTPGGDGTCQFSAGNPKDYQDASATQTFSTSNGQCISVDFSYPSNFGICSGDVLTAYDGPSIFSPIANSGTASYTNTFTAPTNFSTVSSSITFEFTATSNDHARGWQIGLSCTNCPATSSNNDCGNAQVLTVSPTCNYISGSVSITNSDNLGLPTTCTSGTSDNDDVWYSFTAINNTATITVPATDGTMDAVVQMFSGTCGAFTSLYCQNTVGVGGTEIISATGLTAGTTYYVRVYDAAVNNANHTFNICVVSTTNNDCLTATQVCSTTDTISHTAFGNPDYGTQEWNSSYWGCNLSQEARTAWYYFQLATSGTFGFSIIPPSSAYMDNDFVLWGPLSGLNCPMSTAPLRCDWSKGTASNPYGLPDYSSGLQSGESDLTSGSSGNSFVQTVNGAAGQWYVLMVNIYSGANNYTITWNNNIPLNQQATISACAGCVPPTASEAAISANGSTTLCTGESVVLTVASAGLTYQWKNGGSISGATNQSFTATASGSYQCDVSDTCGTTSSNIITVIVNSSPTASQALISAAGSTTFCFGGSVVLSVATAGLTYQWRYGGSTVSGATNQNFTATASGEYECDVSNNCGEITSNPITITVNNAPSSSQAAISANGSTTICSGGSVVLTVATSGLTYQWKKGGTNISGATNQSLTATTSGSYKCNVSNSCGTTTSNIISVTVSTGPTVAQAMISASDTTSFCNGGSVVLMVATAGLTYQWKNSGSTISGATAQSLTAIASGSYTCEVSNSCGNITSNSITVTVNTGPSASEAAITAGGPTTFCSGNTVVELSVATAGLTYQWKKGNNIIVGAVLQHFSASKTGNYKCDVSNSCGTTTSNSISVTVNPAPTSTVSQAPCNAGAVLLTCTYTPSNGVTFKWRKGGVNINGATNSTYSATQTATYKCIVTITATGCTKLSNGSNVTISCKLGDVLDNDKVIVYPNPTSDYYNISIAQFDPQSVIYIYDLTGRLVESHKVTGGEMKAGETLSNGVYFLKIASNNEMQQVIKLVKNF